MEKCLDDYLSDRIPPADLAIHYHIGTAFYGETDFLLTGDGAYQLWSTVTEGRQRHEYSGQMGVSDVQEVVRTMLSVRLWEVKHVFSERGRDNPEARIVVTCGEQTFPVVLWVMEIDDVPAFDEVQEKILKLVRRVSDDEVEEPGR